MLALKSLVYRTGLDVPAFDSIVGYQSCLALEDRAMQLPTSCQLLIEAGYLRALLVPGAFYSLPLSPSDGHAGASGGGVDGDGRGELRYFQRLDQTSARKRVVKTAASPEVGAFDASVLFFSRWSSHDVDAAGCVEVLGQPCDQHVDILKLAPWQAFQASLLVHDVAHGAGDACVRLSNPRPPQVQLGPRGLAAQTAPLYSIMFESRRQGCSTVRAERIDQACAVQKTP